MHTVFTEKAEQNIKHTTTLHNNNNKKKNVSFQKPGTNFAE